MKLKETPGFTETFMPLIAHFEKYGITSSLEPCSTPALLIQSLLDAEVTDLSYNTNSGIYHIDLQGVQCPERNIYDFIFGTHERPSANSLLIDLDENFFSFMCLTIDSPTGQLLPLARGLLDEHGLVKVHTYDYETDSDKFELIKPDIMTSEEYALFLEANTVKGCIKWIEVE